MRVFVDYAGYVRNFIVRKNKQLCVQEFSADREFRKLTGQGGKLAVLYVVISDVKFLNKL